MSTTVFKLPDLGEGLQEVEIISWHVTEGDFVVNEQPLLSVETEKAVVDIPSPQAGKIMKLHGSPGQTLKIGTVLVEFTNDNGETSPDAGSVVGNLEAQSTKNQPPSVDLISMTAHADVKAVPAARKLAQEQGLDLSQITGTGPQGIITVQDVQKGTTPNVSPQANMQPQEGYVPLSGIRKTMAQYMTKSHAEVVPATLHDEVDIQAWHGRDKIMIRLIQAVVRACQAVPIVNSWFENKALKANDTVNLGIAVDTKDGLLVPVLKKADTLSPEQIATELERLKQGAHSRNLSPTDFKDGTLTLSNFGAIAGSHGAMVISPPQVAIIGAGRLQEKPVAVNGRVEIHKVLPLSLTIDHRALTGGEAARFLATVIDTLSH